MRACSIWRVTDFASSATPLSNGRADDDDTLEFPVDLTAVNLVVKQASGGIVTPPHRRRDRHYEHITSAGANRFASVNSSVTIGFDVWYDLPSLRREALVTVTLSFMDNDGRSFSKAFDVRVAP